MKWGNALPCPWPVLIKCRTWRLRRSGRRSPRWPPWPSCPPPPASPSPCAVWRGPDPRSSRRRGSRGWTSPGWRCTSRCRWSRAPCSPPCPRGPAPPRPRGSPPPGRGQRSWNILFMLVRFQRLSISTFSKHISSILEYASEYKIVKFNEGKTKNRQTNILRSTKWFSNALLSTAIKYYDRFDRWIVQSNILEETTKLCNIKYYLDGYLREGKDWGWEDDIPHETISSIFLLRHYPFSAALPSPPVCGVWAVRRANDGLWELILQQRDHVCSLMLEARKLEIGRNFRDKGGKTFKG